MPLDPGLQILTNYRSWQNSVEVCSGLGGKVVIGRTENSRSEMKELVREHTESCGGGLFLGYSDLVTEGEWKAVRPKTKSCLKDLRTKSIILVKKDLSRKMRTK